MTGSMLRRALMPRADNARLMERSANAISTGFYVTRGLIAQLAS
jgi:hypothetical protein